MNIMQKLRNLFVAAGMLLGSVVLFAFSEDGYAVVLYILCLSLVLTGLRSLVYYFTMARHMVGGKRVLYRGVILLDFGAFTMGISQLPSSGYILLYLLGSHVFSSVVAILRALEEKRYASPSWRFGMVHGVIGIAIAVVCLLFIRSDRTAVYIYAIGLLYGAIIRILSTFRRTAIVYIQ